MDYYLTQEHLLTMLVTVVVVFACVYLHYLAFRGLTALMPRIHTRPRARILTLVFGIVILHGIEVWLFGLTYFFLLQDPAFGTLSGISLAGIFDYVYYSAVVFTTLGFGDLIPDGPIRFLTGVEAVIGLTLITWSASFTFLEMQRFWDTR